MSNFVKKQKVSLKHHFGNETEFSKWLASDEGIEYLQEVLGVDLTTEGTEVKPNKKFSSDIVFSIDGQDAKVVVENQYGRTDHNHFSKLITYAVSNKAKFAVWVAEEIHPEHKASIDWLNQNTNQNINIYVFKAVIEKIGDSDKSFSLDCVCEPDEKGKINKEPLTDNSKLSLAQLDFWQNFSLAINEKKDLPFRSRKGLAQHWYSISVGTSQCHISICLLSNEKKVRLELWISNNKRVFDVLFAKKSEIEQATGKTLSWDRKDGAKASSVSYEILDGFDIHDKEKQDEYISTILKELKEFYKIAEFARNIK